MPDIEYQIKTGDTLAGVARRYKLSVDVLSRANGITNPNRLVAGQVVRVPASGQNTVIPQPPPEPLTHRVCAGETLSKIAARYDLTVETLVQLNNIRDPNLIHIGQVLKLQPTSNGNSGSPQNIAPQNIAPQNIAPQNIAPQNTPTQNTRSPNTTPQVSTTTSPQQVITQRSSGSGSGPQGNALMEVAFRITGTFEGGKATTYQNRDSGIVSYGKHQATLASGTLHTILERYIKRSTGNAALLLVGYMEKVKKKDSSLRTDAGFKRALLEAGSDPLMGLIQDEVFAQKFWPVAVQGAKNDKLQSPLALAMYYDTNIQGGLADVRTATAKSMKGKPFTEAAYLTEFNRQRDLRLQRLVEAKRNKGLNEDARMLDSSRKRVDALQSLVTAGDLQLRGDRNGMLNLNGHKVRGLAAGSGSGSTPQQPVISQPTLPSTSAPSTIVKPPVVSKPSPNFSSRNGTKIDAIILHHTASNNVAADLRTLTSASAKVSSHYLIGPDGTIYQLVADEMNAWHAGDSAIRGQKRPGVNSRSIGIEITNDGLGRTPFTEAQYKALEQLVPYLARAYKVPMENILGHRDIAPGRKIDPADNFDWSRVRRAVDAANGAKVGTNPSSGQTSTASNSTQKWKPAPPLSDVLNKGAVLKEGMMGPAVSELQRLLNLPSPDGKFGTNTKLAVKAFHATAGLKLSPGLEGTAGKATFDALKKDNGQSLGIDLKDIARNVHDAMEDGILQTDEHKVYVNLARLNHDEKLIKEFKLTYKSMYREDVVDVIKSEFSNNWFSGNELDQALSYLQPKRSQTPTGSRNNVSGTTPPPPVRTSGGAKEASGKHWVSRFLPSNKVSDLKEPFQSSVRNFLAALRAANVAVNINTTLRPPQRSYLMYYAREIKAGRLSPDQVPAFLPQSKDLPVNIDWAHRDSSGKADLAAAKKAAAEMDKAYGAAGAIGKPYKSNHNGGEAIDMSFTPEWGIGKSVVDATGKTVAIRSKADIIKVGATFGVYHWNYSGSKSKNDDPHWSRTGN
jgi:N-acetyl-anhydromuramyl-L-alanine amidase AmpD/LysM repeat protein